MFTCAKKFNAISFTLCAAAVLTAGCASTKQAGLIYSSAISMGVGMDVKPGDAAAPLSINIGFKTLDVAYVPVAVMEPKGQDKENVEKIWASHSHNSGQSKECLQARQRATQRTSPDTGPAPAATAAASDAEIVAACDLKIDAMSVYGQFNGDAAAKGNDRSAGLMVGRVFATGVAAQNVSAAAVWLAYAACAAAVKASGITVAADLDAETKRVCGGHRS